jgi:protein FAM32A
MEGHSWHVMVPPFDLPPDSASFAIAYLSDATGCILPPSTHHDMPADEYASTVRGGLKLKGGAPAGIKKKKKKPKNSEVKTSALQAALGDDDAAVAGSEDVVKKGKGPEEAEKNDDERDEDLYEGKTASERAYEEMRKKRVGFYSICSVPKVEVVCLLMGEGAKHYNWRMS